MTCDDMYDDLSGWLDGELDAARVGLVSEHLASCERCRASSLAWGELSARLRAEGRRTPAPPAWERMAERLVWRPEHARHDRYTQNGGHAERTSSPAVLERPSATQPSKRRIALRLAACAAAASILLAIGAVFALRPWGSASARAGTESIPPELVRQLVDADRRPDLSVLGAVTPVSWDRFSAQPRDARFAPLTPASLPGGYLFDEGWLIDAKLCRMVCARYKKDGRIVAILQAESSGAPICTLANPQCCRMAGLMCRRTRIDRIDVVQATRGGLAVTVAANAGETDMEAVMATLNSTAGVRKD